MNLTQVYETGCENRKTALGLADNRPRFSWKFRNALRQTAWEIEVASSAEKLESGDADLWKSGKVISDSQVLVPYSGVELQPGQYCVWRVRVWDERDRASGWSRTGELSIGLIDGMEGEYIGLSGKGLDPRAPLFRKQMEFSPKAQKVFAHINSLGYHELYVNGAKVGENVLSPAVSQLDRHSNIVTYDITDKVHGGLNDVVVWLGQGWYKKTTFSAQYDGPLFKGCFEEVVDGQRRTVALTGEGWAAAPGGCHDTGTWQALRFGGECVDGRIVPENMDSGTLDALKWHKAAILPVKGMMATPQLCDGNRIIAETAPERVTSLGGGVWLLDMGRVLNGWLRLDLAGLQPGQEVLMEYSDYENEDGSFAEQGEADIYIAAGREREVFCNRFHSHAYRYVRISGLASAPSARALQISGNYDSASSFICSDADLNAVHDMINYTMRCLTFSGYMVDCPHLERTGYGGDGNSSTMTLQTMYDVAPVFHNWLAAWRDVIGVDGSLPHVAPAGGGGGGPYWCGFIVLAPWRTWLNYSDDKIARESYGAMKSWLGYVRKYSRDGLLSRWPDTENRMWYLGDWLAPEGVDPGDARSVDLVSNCLVSDCLSAMCHMAERLGFQEDARDFSLWKEELKRTVHERFFNPSDNTYGSGSPLDISYAMNTGVVPQEFREAVKERLRQLSREKYNSHITVGLVGVPVFTEYAVRNREVELMYDILKQKDYPGYLHMIENGATATWEYWNGERSHVHNCYNGVGTWFYQALGGIVPDAQNPGYRHFFIDPQYPSGLDWVKVTKESPYGEIRVSWKRKCGRISLDVTVPEGSTATLTLPKTGRTVELGPGRHRY